MVDYKKLAKKLHISVAIPLVDSELVDFQRKIEENKKRKLAKELNEAIRKNISGRDLALKSKSKEKLNTVESRRKSSSKSNRSSISRKSTL